MSLIRRKCAHEECNEIIELDQSVFDAGGGRYHSAECQAKGIYSHGKDRFGMDANAPSGWINAVLFEAAGCPRTVSEIAAAINQKCTQEEFISEDRVLHHLDVWIKRPESRLGRVLRNSANVWYLETADSE